MGHPLIDRLTDELGWPRLTTREELAAFTETGVTALFLPGDPRRNLESADVAVILPELRIAFQRAFDCAVVDDAIEAQLREETRVLKTPSVIFYRDGQFLGGIPKVRDWDDYIARIPQILSAEPANAA
ncbi:hydrogenase accessory protein [Psychromarinibacter sp. S121]|uniref:hydrogenase accessory protein n=1 Tax=Psychromarinibacter sp. S121 TaxID=3415127 RepID=UPI003C7CA920